MSIDVATLTGLVDLEAPDARRITPEAIAHGLAQNNRWAGSTQLPVTIAQHSVLVADIFRKRRVGLTPWQILPLLHDAHEYLIGDIIAPALRLLDKRLPGAAAAIEAEKQRLDVHIRAALGVMPAMRHELQQTIAAAIADADLAAYDVEWRSFMPVSNGASPWMEHGRRMGVAGMTIKAWPWPAAHDRYLEALQSELKRRPWEMAN